MITPSKLTFSAKAAATLTASWPVMASTTISIWSGLTASRIAAASAIISSSTCSRPAVSTITKSRSVSTACANAGLGDSHDVGSLAAVDRDVELLAERLELVDGCRPVDVAGDHQRALALLAHEVGELRGRGGLAGALQPDEHDDVGNAPGEHELRTRAAEQVGQLVEDDLDDLLARGQRLHHVGADGALADLGHELLDDLVVHVGLEQRHADLAHRRVDIGLGQPALAGQSREDRLKPVGEVLEHGCGTFRIGECVRHQR